MQRRTLIYSLILVILGIAIAIVVILILRKRAMGPEIVVIPSTSPTVNGQSGQAPPKGTETGDPTKPHDSYEVAPAWKEGDAPVQPIYRPEPLIVPET